MALDFPSNPTDGQVFGSYVYVASKGVWQSIEESASPAILSPTKPLSGVDGDIWVNTSEGTAFVYYNDGSSSQWIELISSREIDLSTKANITSPTFSGTVTMPSTTSIGSVDSTEIGYLDGVTSGIQTQLNNKASSSHTHATTDVTSGTFAYDRLPAGTVIQQTNTKYTPLVTTGSTSFVNFTSVNFTPKLSNSLILIQAMFSTSNGGAVQVRNHSGTSIFTPYYAFHVFAGVGGPDYGASTIRIPYFLQCTDLPGTTATRTYYFDFRVYAGTFAINEGGSGVSSITITEIKQ